MTITLRFYTLRFFVRGFSRSISAASSSSSSESSSSESVRSLSAFPRKYSIASGKISFAIRMPTYDIYQKVQLIIYHWNSTHLTRVTIVLEKVEEAARFRNAVFIFRHLTRIDLCERLFRFLPTNFCALYVN